MGTFARLQLSPSHATTFFAAGFPCQPFSKARDYSEPGDQELSELYLHILRVIRHHHPKFLILENVPNFEKHEDGQTWERVQDLLRAEGYSVRLKKLSPHEFGIPQIRQRIYIVGSRSSLSQFRWPKRTNTDVSIDSVLGSSPAEARQIPERVEQCLDVWQEFLDLVPEEEKIPHPLWSMEFGATYRYQRTTPWATRMETLRGQKGSHGRSLSKAATKEEMLAILPSHARTVQAAVSRLEDRVHQEKSGFLQSTPKLARRMDGENQGGFRRASRSLSGTAKRRTLAMRSGRSGST